MGIDSRHALQLKQHRENLYRENIEFQMLHPLCCGQTLISQQKTQTKPNKQTNNKHTEAKKKSRDTEQFETSQLIQLTAFGEPTLGEGQSPATGGGRGGAAEQGGEGPRGGEGGGDGPGPGLLLKTIGDRFPR